ncbi:hypothetical protein PCE1_002068 [Barthelona sp. PCE]
MAFSVNEEFPLLIDNDDAANVKDSKPKKLGFWSTLFRIAKKGFSGWGSKVTRLVLLLLVISIINTILRYYWVSIPSHIQKSLRSKDKNVFVDSSIRGALYIVGLGICASVFKYFGNYTKALYRKNINIHCHEKYMHGDMYYQLAFTRALDNPDQRLTKDIDLWSQSFGALFYRIWNCMLDVGVMAYSLYKTIEIFALVPVVALLLCVLVICLLIKRVVPRIVKQQELEGTFRDKHTTIKDQAEVYAFTKQDRLLQKQLDSRIHDVVMNYKSIQWGYFPIDLWNQIFAFGKIIFGFMLPGLLYFFIDKFHTDDFMDGVLTSALATAEIFSQIKQINHIVEDSAALVGYTTRVGEFLCYEAHKNRFTSLVLKDPKAILVKGPLVSPNGEEIISAINVSFDFEQYKSFALVGPSGCGKSSLVRVLGGLWSSHYVEKYSDIKFFPQQPHIPSNDLFEYIMYPEQAKSINMVRLMNIAKMTRMDIWFGLDHIDEDGNYIPFRVNDTLSPGEIQRLTFTRMLYNASTTSICVADEPTSALPLEEGRILLALLKEEYFGVIAIVHDESLHDVFENVIEFENLTF